MDLDFFGLFWKGPPPLPQSYNITKDKQYITEVSSETQTLS